MSLIGELRKNEKVIASMGERIRQESRVLGATFSYIDPSHPDQIVIEYPDDRKEFKPLLMGATSIFDSSAAAAPRRVLQVDNRMVTQNS
jgi:hypothetical protein